MLRGLDRWLVWRYEWRQGSKGEGGAWNKTPRQINGNFASTNDPRTWCTFKEAVFAHSHGDFDGIGIVLPKTVVGIDLDDMINRKGRLSEEAKVILAQMHTYAEYSPSGTGLKLIAGGRLSQELRKVDHKRGIEMYDGGGTNRYFTITGHVVDELHSEITAQREGLDILQGYISDPIAESYEDPDYEASADDVRLAVDCLSWLSDDYYDEYSLWLAVGMSLKSVDASDEMLAQWVEWSSQSPKFDGPEACRMKWDSFKREVGRVIGFPWLKRAAVACGWRENKYRTGLVKASHFLTKEIVRNYAVVDFLVENEPMIIGGPTKALKTTTVSDLAISLATGTKFLGMFDVPEPRKVAFISGESGEGTTQDTLRSIAEERGLDFDEIENLYVGFKLPKLDDPLEVADLVEELKAEGIDFVIIDPLYRSLRVGSDASNIFAMGERLEQIAEQIHRAGLTPILVHHFRKQGVSFGIPPDLEDLSQSGAAEFGRQFMLLKRREAFEYDGKHVCWFVWGGSAGHQGIRVLKADTGTNVTGLKWETELVHLKDYEADAAGKKEAEKANKAAEMEERVLAALVSNGELSLSKLERAVTGNKASIKAAVERMVERGEVEENRKGQARIFSMAEDFDFGDDEGEKQGQDPAGSDLI